MVTHDAHAAAIADRVLFLADGDIVRDLGPSTAHEILETLEAGERAMIAVALKGLAGRKVRALLTALAVVIGISMVSGTYILTDTMQKSFDGLFTATYDKTDAVISRQGDRQGLDHRTPSRSPPRCWPRSQALPEVGAAGGSVTPDEANAADIIGTDGKPVARESVGGSYDPAHREFSPLKLKSGDWAKGPRQVVVDAGTVAKQHYKLGDSIKVSTFGAKRSYELTGIVTYGDVDSLGFASIAAWDLKTAQTLLHREGSFDSISDLGRARAPRRRSSSAPSRRCVPADLQVKDSAKQAKDDADELNSSMSILKYFLLGFGALSLLVGAFVIFNTLSITVAQRTREFATLRTLGGSRKQVMRSVVAEGLVIGLLASVLGLLAGHRARQGHGRAVRRAWASSCPTRRPSSRRARSSSRSSSARSSRSLASILPARAGDPRAADRGGPRGLDAAALALRRAHVQGRPRRRRRSRGRAARRAVRRRARAPLAIGRAARRRRARRCSSAWRCSRRAWSPRWPASSACRRAPSAASPVSWPAPTPSATPGRTASTAAALMIGLTLVTLVAVLGSSISKATHGARSRRRSTRATSSTARTACRSGPPGRRAGARARASSAPRTSARTRCSSTARSARSRASTRPRSRTSTRSSGPRAPSSALGKLGTDGAIVTKELRQGPPPGDRQHARHHDALGRQAHARRARHPQAAKTQLLGDVSMTQQGFDTASRPAEEQPHVPRRAAPARTRSSPRSRASATPRSTRAPATPRTRRKEWRDAVDALRAARLLGDRQPVRDGQHAGALGLRAHARDRDAAHDRHDAPPGAPDDPPREHHHGADRRRARPRRSARRSPRS